MATEMSSRERMLTVMDCGKPDRVPCCFMIFNALRHQCQDQAEFVRRQVDMGLDTFVGLPVRKARRDRSTSEQGDLHGLPVTFPPDVEVEDWLEGYADKKYPLLHRTYRTPAGQLHTTVRKTDDWVQGNRVPLFDDYVIPRAEEPLITGSEDLPALESLLQHPTNSQIQDFRASSQPAKELARELELVTAGEWGVLLDAACWLCGIEALMTAPVMAPKFLDDLLSILWEWNRSRMEVVLQEGVDFFIRRAWYEHADMMSPQHYRRFILPRLKKDAEIVHQAGSRLALITTSCYNPLLDFYREAGVDVLMGVDPIQDPRADFAETRRKAQDELCLWGGVNGFVTVERGSEKEVRQAVREAINTFAPGGGFVLSPVDNVTEDTEISRANVEALLDEWRKQRGYAR